MASHVAPLVVAALAALATSPAQASAELRTSHYANPEVSEPGSATNPQVAAMVLTYDTVTGNLDIHLRFFTPLADPSQTSGLRQAVAQVELGDAFGGSIFPGCDRARDGVMLQAELGSTEAPTVMDQQFGRILSEVSSTKTFSADHSELELTATGPRLVGLNLICARIQAWNNAEKNASFYSPPFLLDGFSIFDGDVAWSASNDVDDQARWVNNDLGHRGERSELSFRSGFTCKGGGYLYRCSGKRRMPGIVGQPTLSITGTQTFELHHTMLGELFVWSHDERASLTWWRCPHSLSISGTRAGHRCSLVVRWRHSSDLWPLFERDGLRANRK